MLIIGSHVSLGGKEMLVGSVKEAISYGANTFMFYTGAPQNTVRKPINEFNLLEAKKLMLENNIDINNVIVHSPYIINLANVDNEKGQFAIDFLTNEVKRVEEIGCRYLVLHPGSHVGAGEEVGLKAIVDNLNTVLSQDNTDVIILLETMAGKGSELGRTFEEIKMIYDGVHKRNRLQCCISMTA